MADESDVQQVDSVVQFRRGGALHSDPDDQLDDTVMVEDSGIGATKMTSTPAMPRRPLSEEEADEEAATVAAALEDADVLEKAALAIRRRPTGLSRDDYRELSTILRRRSLLPESGPDLQEPEPLAVGGVGARPKSLPIAGARSPSDDETPGQLRRLPPEEAASGSFDPAAMYAQGRPSEWRTSGTYGRGPREDLSGEVREPPFFSDDAQQFPAGDGALAQSRRRSREAAGSGYNLGQDATPVFPVRRSSAGGPRVGGSASIGDGTRRPPLGGVRGSRQGRVFGDANRAPADAVLRDLVRDVGPLRPQGNYPDHWRKQKKAPSFDGKMSFSDFKIQFEMVAERNGWSEPEKAAELATSLTGSAITVLGALSPTQRRSYEELVAALQRRFEPAYQGKLLKNQLKTRRRRRGETLEDLAEDILRDVRRAYPTAQESALWDGFAHDAFMEALDDEQMQLFVTSGNPGSLEEAVERAMAYEIHKKKTAQRRGDRGDRVATVTTVTEEAVKHLCTQCGHTCPRAPAAGTPRPGVLPRAQNAPRGLDAGESLCYNCGQPGHWRRECPFARRPRYVPPVSPVASEGQPRQPENRQ